MGKRAQIHILCHVDADDYTDTYIVSQIQVRNMGISS